MPKAKVRNPIWLAKMPPLSFSLVHQPEHPFPMVPAIAVAGDAWGLVLGGHPDNASKVWFVPTHVGRPDLWIVPSEDLRVDIDHPNGVQFLLRWLGPRDTILDDGWSDYVVGAAAGDVQDEDKFTIVLAVMEAWEREQMGKVSKATRTLLLEHGHRPYGEKTCAHPGCTKIWIPGLLIGWEELPRFCEEHEEEIQVYTSDTGKVVTDVDTSKVVTVAQDDLDGFMDEVSDALEAGDFEGKKVIVVDSLISSPDIQPANDTDKTTDTGKPPFDFLDGVHLIRHGYRWPAVVAEVVDTDTRLLSLRDVPDANPVTADIENIVEMVGTTNLPLGHSGIWEAYENKARVQEEPWPTAGVCLIRHNHRWIGILNQVLHHGKRKITLHGVLVPEYITVDADELIKRSERRDLNMGLPRRWADAERTAAQNPGASWEQLGRPDYSKPVVYI